MLKNIEDYSRITHELTNIGFRLRQLRRSKGVTLRGLSKQTGLSPSMLSLVERGKASPSIGSLILICSALDARMIDLLADTGTPTSGPVLRAIAQPIFETPNGVLHRLLRDDAARGIEISLDEYKPQTGNSTSPVRHAGYEYGVVLDGELTVTLAGVEHQLMPGDLIFYDSDVPHRIWNHGRNSARTIWITLNKRRSTEQNMMNTPESMKSIPST